MYAEMFSKKIKKARENTGFTQREVCEELRLKQSTLASYEKEEHNQTMKP